VPGVFALIGNSWNFLKKQPVLLSVGLWLLAIPMFVEGALTRFIKLHPLSDPANAGPVSVSYIGIFLGIIVVIWGTLCVIVVGQRLIAKAGRSRTSFSAVRAEARGLLIPYFLTSILRGIFTFLWSLLLIIPGIVYSVRTSLFPVIVVVEGISYRAALKRSKTLIAGSAWKVFWRMVGIGIILFVVPGIIGGMQGNALDTPSIVVLGIIANLLNALASTLFLLCLVQMYGALRPSKGPVTGGKKRK
jgi:uncharacterized membrane protein